MVQETVLVVDDQPLIGLWLEDFLSEQGFSAVVATGSDDANAHIDKQHGFAAVITDIDLGSGCPSGWDVARHAREIDPWVPVIYITGKSAAEWLEQGVRDSVVLLKPFSVDDMAQAIALLRVRPVANG